MKWTADKVFVVCMVMLVLAFVINMFVPPAGVWNPTCYNGHRYNIHSNGVMWPIQTKYGVQKCLPGEIDVYR